MDAVAGFFRGRLRRRGSLYVCAFLLQNFYAVHRCVEMKIDMILHFRVQVAQYDIVDVRAQMTDRGVQKPQLVLNTDLFKIRSRSRIEFRSLTAVVQIDLIHVAHQFQRLFSADMRIQRAAEIIRNIVFAVAESPCTSETGHNGTAPAADAGFDLVSVDGTVPLLKLRAALKDTDLPAGPSLHQFIRGKNTARAGPDDDYVVFHKINLLLHNHGRSVPGSFISHTQNILSLFVPFTVFEDPEFAEIGKYCLAENLLFTDIGILLCFLRSIRESLIEGIVRPVAGIL